MLDSKSVSTNSVLSASITEKELLPNLIQFHLNQGHSVSLWRLPNTNEKRLLVCTSEILKYTDVVLEEFEPGFIFSPFNPSKPKLFLRGDLLFTFQAGKLVSDSESKMNTGTYFLDLETHKKQSYYYRSITSGGDTLKESYISLVEKSLEEIASGLVEKVVPSRRQTFKLPVDFNPLETFDKLCAVYPHAFVSLVSTPETGTWIGATPELLVSIDANQKFRTVALAGTKIFEPAKDIKAVAWTQKDIEEQALVSRYIINCFKKIRLREYAEHGPRTAVAGNLIHLKTDYEVDMVSTNFPQLGSVMLKLLHPTSAVCGMPLEAALNFLKHNEGYDREYYSGFLGPVNIENESTIFVNLRCMQLAKEDAVCYAGAGITSGSEPEQEWHETEMKMNTLLHVLANTTL
jgi:isochorismate synthase